MYRLDFSKSFEKALRSDDPHATLASTVASKLTAMVEPLRDKDRHFEAEETQEVADAFRTFADGGRGDLVSLWDDLMNWGETSVMSGGREKSLCTVPYLPDDFG